MGDRSLTANTVLLIEDEDSIAEMLRLVLEREGFVFTHTFDGESGLVHLRRSQPSVILLDLNLPGMDGIDVCRRIRSVSDVPIIMLTARDAEIDRVVGLEIGADDYVSKPFSTRELLARIRAVLRRTQETPRGQSRLDRNGWLIDASRREVTTKDGRVIRPTAREFDLLWYLADNQGLALSRNQILQAVWGYDYFGETRTVDVHIRQLRKKLEGIPITTVWGVGYRFEDD